MKRFSTLFLLCLFCGSVRASFEPPDDLRPYLPPANQWNVRFEGEEEGCDWWFVVDTSAWLCFPVEQEVGVEEVRAFLAFTRWYQEICLPLSLPDRTEAIDYFGSEIYPLYFRDDSGP